MRLLKTIISLLLFFCATSVVAQSCDMIPELIRRVQVEYIDKGLYEEALERLDKIHDYEGLSKCSNIKLVDDKIQEVQKTVLGLVRKGAEIKNAIDAIQADYVDKGLIEDAIRRLSSLRNDRNYRGCPALTQVDSKLFELRETIHRQNYSSSNKTFTVKGVQFTMVAVNGGTFMMGSDDKDADGMEGPAHEVTLSSYMLGETEVTQALWQAVMGKNPAEFASNPQNPVENVSWEDCQVFVESLNALTADQRPAGRKFRLPTEAEWEFAARGGRKSQNYPYIGGEYNDLESLAWFFRNSGDHAINGIFDWSEIQANHCIPHPVKTKRANELGLYDMGGNVWEWCQDFMGNYTPDLQINPTGVETGLSRVTRGGNYEYHETFLRASYRYKQRPEVRYKSIGFRLAL